MVKIILTLLLVSKLVSAQTSKLYVIGDYGEAGPNAKAVADRIKLSCDKNSIGQPLNAIITVGDNNYPNGDYGTADDNIGQYYSMFIYPYKGSYRWNGNDNRPKFGSLVGNLFYFCGGNHDWYSNSEAAWNEYMGYSIAQNRISGNNRFYNFKLPGFPQCEFFILNSAYGNFTTLGRFNAEPYGIDSSGIQAQWLKSSLLNSTAKFKFVFLHHPPWSSVQAGLQDTYFILRWPYKRWGATALFTGHNHLFEFLIVNDLPVFVNGCGGGHQDGDIRTLVVRSDSKALIGRTTPGTEVFGFQTMTAFTDSVQVRFIDVNSVTRHSYTIKESGSPPPPPPPNPLTPLDSLKRRVDEIDQRVRILEQQ